MKICSKRRIRSLALILAGILFIGLGISRKEFITVEEKSNIICLECIGIG